MKTITTFLLMLCFLMSCKNDKTIPPVNNEISKAWWKEGGLFQIYPQSFKDSDGDGFGDFKGVIEELDCLESSRITQFYRS